MSAGYLVCHINNGGYIYGSEQGRMVHRSTRNMQEWCGCYSTLEEARTALPEGRDCYFVLELTPEGGGGTIWAPPQAEKTVAERLVHWRGCYGLWAVGSLAEGN
jgi:hypothetical protein